MEHGRLESIVVSLPEVKPSKRPVVLDGVVLPEIGEGERPIVWIGNMPDDAGEDVCEKRTGVRGGAKGGFEVGLGKVLAVPGSVSLSVDEKLSSRVIGFLQVVVICQ